VLQKVAVDMAERKYSPRKIFAVRLALEEAIVNAIRHGHHDDPSRKVRVRFQVRPARVLLEVRDRGNGFDPEQVPDPCAPENLERSSGRGLLLMRAYMSWIRFNSRGNCLTMCLSRF
jgi:serine/threonine-protein kinase RsbW